MQDEPTSGRFDGRIHVLPIRIYYEDTDFTGIVYHGNYLRYLERGRSDFLRLAGIAHADLLAESDPIAFAILAMTIEFRRPARIDDALSVRTAFDAIRGARLLIAQEVRRGEDLLARADVQACCISLTGAPKRPPKMLAERLRPYLDPAQSTF